MIHTLNLGCTPGGSCCDKCRAGNLRGIDDAAAGNEATGAWWSLAAIVGGFLIAAAASGKLGKGKL